MEYTASLIEGSEVNVLDIRDWDVPMYSINMDPDQTPEQITKLIDLINTHDGFILSSPEHNGATPAFLKNIIDWLSRRGNKIFSDKPMLLMSTSPGGKGGQTNLNYLTHSLPYQGAKVAASYSLPSFYDNFKEGKILDEQLGILQEKIALFKEALNG